MAKSNKLRYAAKCRALKANRVQQRDLIDSELHDFENFHPSKLPPEHLAFFTMTLDNLLNQRKHMSFFATHYANNYLSTGRSYHALPMSARDNPAVTREFKEIAAEALTAAPLHKELPQLVQVLGEMSFRLRGTEVYVEAGNLAGLMVQLRRCGNLLMEAEMTLRLLKDVVEEMVVEWEREGGDDEGYGGSLPEGEEDEGEIAGDTTEKQDNVIEGNNRGGVQYGEGEEMRVLMDGWMRALPQICFATAEPDGYKGE